MPQMKALRYLPAKNIAKGDTFEARDGEAKLLVAMGFAKILPLKKARQARAPKIAEPPRQKRAYKRRDMRAEG